jgi:hypothetical protein
MKIWKIASEATIKEIPKEDLSGSAWDMMDSKLDKSLYGGYWQTAKIPQMLYAARGIWGELVDELGSEYVSQTYIKEKLEIIKTWANQLASQNIHPSDHPEMAQSKDAAAISTVKKVIESLNAKTAQQIATKRLMEGIIDGNSKVILENINYLSRWIDAVENAQQNIGSEPKY